MQHLILEGDCTDWMQKLRDTGQLFDAVITDPPYHLTSIVERFGKEGSAPAKSNGATGVYARASKGFMGKEWDGGDIAFRPETWKLVSELLKPGAHLICFGGTRTFHRVACAIEDTGFEIRDCLMWLYGTGFPKSHDTERAIAGITCPLSGRHFGSSLPTKGRLPDDHICPTTAESEPWEGFGTALKPAWEPIILARKPLIGTVAANVLAHRTGAINIDACRVATTENITNHSQGCASAISKGIYGDSRAQETHQTVGQALGRWPANLIHDGSDEVLACFPDAPGQIVDVSHTAPSQKTSNVYGKMRREGEASANKRYTDKGSTNFAALPGQRRLDSGSAARFYYCAKASKADRAGSKHPTVKPISLMRWLCRLVTPPGGIILDPFAGSGTTGAAALLEGFEIVMIEKEPEYVQDIRKRMAEFEREAA